jgi:hypothetical protein
MTSWEKRGGEPAGFLSLPRVSAWPEVNRGSLKLKPKAAQGEARSFLVGCGSSCAGNFSRSSGLRSSGVLISHDLDDVAALVVYFAGRILRVLPRMTRTQNGRQPAACPRHQALCLPDSS